MSKQFIEKRNAAIRDRYAELRKSGCTQMDAIEQIQADQHLNPHDLSYNYIRRHILFEKKGAVAR